MAENQAKSRTERVQVTRARHGMTHRIKGAMRKMEPRAYSRISILTGLHGTFAPFRIHEINSKKPEMKTRIALVLKWPWPDQAYTGGTNPARHGEIRWTPSARSACAERSAVNGRVALRTTQG
jgi:hypothetical protein